MGWPISGRYLVPEPSSYGCPTHSANAAAMPPHRNDATFNFCQTSRSLRITTAILVSNCMKTPAQEKSAAPRGFKRLRRVDVEKRSVAFDGHLGNGFTVLGDKVPRTDVALQRHQLAEEASRPQYGIAAPALGDWQHDQIAAIGRKGIDQAVDQAGIDQWHVTKADQRPVGALRHRRNSRLDGAG